MIEVSIVTKMQFKTETEFYRFLKTDSAAQICGFADEIREAWESDEPIKLVSPRPEYGAVTLSEMSAVEI